MHRSQLVPLSGRIVMHLHRYHKLMKGSQQYLSKLALVQFALQPQELHIDTFEVNSSHAKQITPSVTILDHYQSYLLTADGGDKTAKYASCAKKQLEVIYNLMKLSNWQDFEEEENINNFREVIVDEKLAGIPLHQQEFNYCFQ